MVIRSATNPTTSYNATSDNCQCTGFRRWGHYWHTTKAAGVEAGRPRNVDEARARRIQRNRETAAASLRYSYGYHD